MSPTRGAGSYRAPSECPGPAEWRAALGARAGEPAPRSGPLEVVIERRAGGASPTYAGHVRQSSAASSAGRSVRGTRCHEVFEALALIARLGLAERAEMPPGPPSTSPGARSAPEPRASPGLSPSPGASELSEPSAAPARWTLSAGEELELARDPLPAASEPAPDGPRIQLAGTALALWGGASSAGEEPDLGLALTARWSGDALQPLVLVGAYTGQERFDVAGTRAGARLERLVLHAVACPLRFPRASALGVRPCVDVDAGVLRGSGVSVDAARGHAAPWVSTGLQLRAEWSPWGPLELGAMIGGVVALSRPRFYFEPDTTAFQAEAAALRAGASAGLSF